MLLSVYGLRLLVTLVAWMGFGFTNTAKNRLVGQTAERFIWFCWDGFCFFGFGVWFFLFVLILFYFFF